MKSFFGDCMVEGTSERLAVVGGERLTYAQFDDQTTRVAAFLRKRAVARGSIVAIHADRSAASIVAMAGVLKAGAAYCFTEVTDSSRETMELLKAGPFDLILSAAVNCDALADAGIDACSFEEARDQSRVHVPQETADTDLAYVLYTSGSTGARKGVMVTHGNVKHYAQALSRRLGVDRPLSYAHVSTLAADLGNTSIFLPLWTGG